MIPGQYLREIVFEAPPGKRIYFGIKPISFLTMFPTLSKSLKYAVTEV